MAGLLGEIFSAGNVAKRKLTDLLGNPLLSAQQFVGNINDRARNLNEMTAAAAREGMDYGPATQRLAGLMADAYNPMGLTVFHGSPAKFNKFDRTKIGSGEGAQAYGYGHYVAESPDVARRYQMGLTQAKGEEVLYKNKPLTDLYSQIENKSMKLSGKAADIENQKLQLVEHMMLDKPPQELIPYAKETGFDQSVIDWLERDVSKNTQIPGAFYEIDLPDEQIARMIDWDKPMSESEMIRIYDLMQQSPLSNFAKAFQDNYYSRMERGTSLTDGQDLFMELSKELGGQKQVSDALRNMGIPGIRYFDEGSRGAGAGTSNFVVFPGNEDLLTILKRNEEPVGLLSSPAEKPVKNLQDIQNKFKDVVLDLYENKGTINLSRIVVPKEMRSTGIGSSVMNDLIGYADTTGQKIALTPSSDFGGNVKRLKDFYKNFGFVENKGKNKDFFTMETMYREPQPVPSAISDDELLRSLLD